MRQVKQRIETLLLPVVGQALMSRADAKATALKSHEILTGGGLKFTPEQIAQVYTFPELIALAKANGVPQTGVLASMAHTWLKSYYAHLTISSPVPTVSSAEPSGPGTGENSASADSAPTDSAHPRASG